MRANRVRQYDLTLGDAEMARLVQAFRIYCRDYEVDGQDEQLLDELEEVFEGSTGGARVDLRAITGDDDEQAAGAAA